MIPKQIHTHSITSAIIIDITSDPITDIPPTGKQFRVRRKLTYLPFSINSNPIQYK